jgi:hypothetical protein
LPGLWMRKTVGDSLPERRSTALLTSTTQHTGPQCPLKMFLDLVVGWASNSVYIGFPLGHEFLGHDLQWHDFDSDSRLETWNLRLTTHLRHCFFSAQTLLQCCSV